MKLFLTYFASILISSQILAKTYGTAINESCYSFLQTSDGGYLLSGDQRMTYAEGYLVKTDAMGNMVWSKSFNDGVQTHSIQFRYAIELADHSGFLVLGTIFYGIERVGWLLRLNNQGDTLWTRQYDPANHFDGTYLEEIGPNDFVIGITETIAFSATQTLLCTMDSLGLINDTTHVVSPASQILKDPNGTYSFVGWANLGITSAIYIHSDAYAVEVVDTSELTSGFGLGSCDYSGSDLIVAGSSTYFSNSYNQYVILKVDPNGDTTWTRHWGTGYLKSVKQYSTNEIYTLGYNDTTQRFFLWKTDANFDTLWTKTFYRRLYPENIAFTSNGYIAVYGDSMNDSLYTRDAWVIFYDDLGNEVTDPSTNISKEHDIVQLTSHPNPCSDQLTIVLPKSVVEKPRIMLINSLGQSLTVELKYIDDRIYLNTQFLSPGIYHFFFEAVRKNFNGTFLVQH